MKDYITFIDFTNLDIEKQYELLVIRDNKISLLEEKIEELEMKNRKLKKDVLDGEIHWHSQKQKRLLEKRKKEKYKQRIGKAIEWIDSHIETYTKNGISIIDWDRFSNPRKLLEIFRGEDDE